MDNVRFGRVIPNRLQRRISRLIPIDDVLKENSTITQQSETDEQNVGFKKVQFFVSPLINLQFL